MKKLCGLKLFFGAVLLLMTCSSFGISEYTGRFTSTFYELRLYKDGDAVQGVLLFDKKEFPVEASVKNGILQGIFRDKRKRRKITLSKQSGLYIFKSTGKAVPMIRITDREDAEHSELSHGLRRKLLRMTSSGTRYYTNTLTMEFAYVEAGTYKRGTDKGSALRARARPAHMVTISQDFLMGKYEVTQAQYKELMGSNPSKFKMMQKPVENVNWNNADRFCKALTEREQMAGNVPIGYEYRLPTEAEWEFAARGGNKSRSYKYAGHNTLYKVGWYGAYSRKHSYKSTYRVGQKQPNELGLYDMSGNVREWCYDLYADYPDNPLTDPIGEAKWDKKPVVRGGSWLDLEMGCELTDRGRSWPNVVHNAKGFRVCLAPILRQ